MSYKDLSKVLSVNGEDYNVNAVKSDEAAKVAQALTINKNNISGNEAIIFDGSTPKNINVVPAEGGEFTGAIKIPTHAEGTQSPNSALNKTEILDLVQNLTGYSWYTYQGDELNPVLNDANDNILKMSVVLGLESGHSAFAKENYINKHLSLYLYICQDTADIYLGYESEASDQLLSKKAEQLVGNAWVEGVDTRISFDVAHLHELEEYLNGTIASQVDELLQRVGTTEVSLETLIQALEGNLTGIDNRLTETNLKVSINKTTTDDLRSGRIDAGIATKARNGMDGKPLNLSFYRTTGNSTTANSITISSSSPSAGNDGDIWIKY